MSSIPTKSFLAAALAFALAGPARAQQVQWRHDYAGAVREAQEKNRPLFVDFYTDSCMWCVKLDAATFRDPAVAGGLNEHFIPLKLDANREPRVARALAVRRFPTTLFAAPDGTVLTVQEGFVAPDAFRQRMHKAMADAVLRDLSTARAEAESSQQ